ncbi:MAG: UTP--glucose-1-phosphate uridylyltransferase GalU [Burkholderia sp.]|nr:UTP--glucose-1-phosphate uridylyltransferase GalU [Burkholderia sp.]
MLKITKAVLPVGGLGTRFLPISKANSKEMLPIVDKPLIQYIVEEVINSDITEIIFVTGRSKKIIEDYFNKSYEIEKELEEKGKNKLLDLIRTIKPRHVNFSYVHQTKALGLGHAILCAEKLIANNPFAVVLTDNLLDAAPPVIKQMIEAFNNYQKSVIGIDEIPLSDTNSYGIIEGKELENSIFKVTNIFEKPKPSLAKSNLGIIGRYILTPRVFKHLSALKPGLNNELQLTDAIQSLLLDENIIAYKYKGTRYDCGSKIGYLKATVEFALRHKEVGTDFQSYLVNKFESLKNRKP